jgi:hypothetical protein
MKHQNLQLAAHLDSEPAINELFSIYEHKSIFSLSLSSSPLHRAP